jgi:hypothetical protein
MPIWRKLCSSKSGVRAVVRGIETSHGMTYHLPIRLKLTRLKMMLRGRIGFSSIKFPSAETVLFLMVAYNLPL